ncbi:TIGR02444 family protein [Motilimonas cestriensis]|uniref:TIGR02444 family protein n=1 Tax=Motilimonas cestriensis TaxID=2742685 RepID=A0ABS8W8R0_9GAMM|nr:TIGR02444 family protein [Motilimonas cestriensis]MCE2595394.1 TIGR02444 family protein [Motilimonas cestriensis]
MNDLWRQCEALYNANTQPTLLQLQNEFALNVNLLLLALFLDKKGLQLSAERWQRLSEQAERYERCILRPYRLARQQLKTQRTPQNYQQILAIELILERALQQQLWQAHLAEQRLAAQTTSHRSMPKNGQRYLAIRTINNKKTTNLFNKLAKLTAVTT